MEELWNRSGILGALRKVMMAVCVFLPPPPKAKEVMFSSLSVCLLLGEKIFFAKYVDQLFVTWQKKKFFFF